MKGFAWRPLWDLLSARLQSIHPIFHPSKFSFTGWNKHIMDEKYGLSLKLIMKIKGP
jgi:hypothetical protein